jgi:hypothetical protein
MASLPVRRSGRNLTIVNPKSEAAKPRQVEVTG